MDLIEMMILFFIGIMFALVFLITRSVLILWLVFQPMGQLLMLVEDRLTLPFLEIMRARVVSPIGHMFRSRSRISENIVGEPLGIGARTIRPVVQLSGWRGTGGDAAADGAGAQLQARPAGVIVLERDGREHGVPTPDNTRLILWGLAGIALLVAVASQVVVRVLR